LARFEFESGIGSAALPLTLGSFGELCLLVSWCAGGSCGMTFNDEDRGRSRRPSAVAGRSRGQVALCAVCTVPPRSPLHVGAL
jgi:hypothetical protein